MASSNPIATAATTGSNYYDVFLSHRGPDVKETLATHLYKRLNVRGLRVFLDKEELQEGDNIPCHLKGAILSASVHIAIFSTNYAESSWCLNELLLMLESRKTIIPIFYGVKPDALRWTLGGNGVYARHLSILEGKKAIDPQSRQEIPRYDTDTIGKWRRALFEAADIKGFEVEAEACMSDHNQLVDNIVESVLKKLPKTPLNVSKYPTGLDDKVRDLQRTVETPQQSGNAKVVGIVGLGGVGKTTLAKEMFNRERSKYHRSCFLPDIREKAASKCLNFLQSTIVYDLTGSKVQINSTTEGIEELKRRVRSDSHALIILDDVDHIHQLDVLLFPMKDVLSSSSLILVTSRNEDVLTSFGIVATSIYKLRGLNPQHSRELFCWHAFHRPQPPAAQFEQLVRKFLDVCQGLPLSLQVIGALLHGKDNLKYWKAQLHKISKILPGDIQSILKISYDGLDPEEKEIFLDIACFFTGETGKGGFNIEICRDMDTAIRIWEGSGWNGWLGLRNIQNRCLVDVVEYSSGNDLKYLRMHDHVRDLGRSLAEKEPIRGHRLWRPTENPLHNLSDQSPVRGLVCVEGSRLVEHRRDNRKRRRSLGQNPVELGNRSIGMSRLELLITPGDRLKDILRRVQSPEYLIWLHCHRFPFASLLHWIPMERLSVLNVEGQRLRRLWGERNFEAPRRLRQLQISAPLLKFPKSIGQLKYLEKIVVRPFEDAPVIELPLKVPLKILPEEFCQLQHLQHLELSSCSEMVSLPESFGNLKNLQHLDLEYCSKLQKLPGSFGNLIQLKHLGLNGCRSLTMFSETLGKITTLQFIDMSGCTKLEVLPPQVAHQRYLSQLLLEGTSIAELPSAIADLRALEILAIGGPSLDMLPAWFGCLWSLKELVISDTLWDSKKLKCLPDSIGKLSQLEKLDIVGTDVEFLPLPIMALNNLSMLLVSNSLLRELPFNRVGGESETGRDSNACMLGLKHLFLESTRISEVAFGKGVCPNLQRLHISNCRLPAEVGTLPSSLVEIVLRHCLQLEKIEGLCCVAKLQTREITNCPKVEELSGLATLISLERLILCKCGVRRILGLQQLTKFRELNVSLCHALESLPGIEHLMLWMRKLTVSNCPNLRWGEEVLEHLRQRRGKDLSDEDLSGDDLSNSSDDSMDNV